MKVKVERHVEQVVDDKHYKGYVMIGDTKLEYELKFGIPISRLDDNEPPEEISEHRKILQLTVKKDGNAIELEDKEYSFFMYILLMFVVGFYNNPQTRANNESPITGSLLRGGGPLAEFGASMSIGATSTGAYSFPPDLCEVLSGPKFGCVLTAAA